MKPHLRVACAALALLLSACRNENARWESAQKASQANPSAVSGAALPGAQFNKYFPQQGDGVDLVFKQEKDGFAQANLMRNGKLIATLSISDTRNNPSARDKFKTAAGKVLEFPLVHLDNTSAILVADRFQVQVQSEGDALTSADRENWLKRFDLVGLGRAF